MDETVFTDVEVTSSRAAAPVVRLAFRDAVLEPVQARVIFVSEFLDLLEDVFFFWRQRLQSTVNVVNHADGS